MVFENMLKKASQQTIKTLQNCDIKTIMATGDNIQTAVYIAKQCNIIDPSHSVYIGDFFEGQMDWKVSSSLTHDIQSVHELPWNIKDHSNYSVAITGNLFREI
jgi:cation-transporting ATPase 13A3/4/5